MNFELNDDNFIIYAIKNYDNPSCKGLDEFNDDLKRFKYIKRLFRKYKSSKLIKERLILNHLIVIYNLFGSEAATKMLFYKIEPDYWPQLKTFLVFLNFMPIKVIVSKGVHVNDSDIPLDENILTILRTI